MCNMKFFRKNGSEKVTFIFWLLPFVLCLFAFLPNVFYCIYSPEIAEKGWLGQILFLLLAASVYVLFLAVFNFRVGLLFFVPCVILAFVEFYHIHTFHITLNESSLVAIFNTRAGEAEELLSSLWIWLVVSIIAVAVYITLSVKCKVFLTNHFRWLLLSFVGAITLLNFCYNFVFNYNKGINLSNDMELTLNSFRMKYEKIYPLSVICKSLTVLEQMHYKSLADDFTFKATTSENIPAIYVLVVGESSRYKNWQINGYDRPTSPFLMATPNLLSFSDCCSASNSTAMSLPFIYTRATPVDRRPEKEEKTIGALYNELGFYTCLIDNQNLFSKGILSRYKEDFDEYINVSDSCVKDTRYDEELLNWFDRVLSLKESRKFIVMQLRGSHFKYVERYPKSFEKFVPVETEEFSINRKDSLNFVNSYDNSILYTDYILHEIISRVNLLDCRSVVLYVSDHGQNLFEDSNNLLHGSPEPFSSEFHVPLFLWFSNHYVEDEFKKVDAARSHIDKKITSENVFYTVANFSDVDFSGNDSTKNILSPFFREDSVRWVFCPNGIFEMKSFN